MPATAEMKDHICKILELVGSSEKGIEDAIQNAISRTSKTIREMKWFEVVQTRGHVENGSVRHYQVILRIGPRVALSHFRQQCCRSPSAVGGASSRLLGKFKAVRYSN